MSKKIMIGLVLVLSVFVFSGCGEKTETKNSADVSTETMAVDKSTATTAQGICGIFTKEFVSAATGLNITTAETYAIDGVDSSNCRYYIDGKKIAPVITIGKFKNDLEKEKKKYLEHPLFKGWMIKNNKEIAMENFVTYNEVGQLNDIYMITGTNEYYRLTLYSFKTIGSNEMVTLALKVEEEIGKK
jgi:hypothetical protein